MALAVPKNIRLHIRHDLANAKFPLASRAKAEELLVRQVRYARIIRRRSEAKTTSRAISGAKVPAKRSRGRPNETQWREYLIAGIFYAWLIGFGDNLTINNKDHAPTPFVRFATVILKREGVGRIHHHLEAFRSYRKRTLEASGFKVVRGVVI